MPGNITNIFISYGRKDARELALRLSEDLQAVGYSVWLDTAEIPGGANWGQEIETAIEFSHIMIAVLSPAAYDSQWCRAEQLRATRKGKRIIPLMAVAGSEVPLHLEHLNYLDFTNTDRYDEMFRDLLSDITAGSAFRLPTDVALDDAISPFPKASLKPRKGYSDEKRTAPSFRRHLEQLRGEEWLGARFWWPYFLFYFTDMHKLIEALTANVLLSPFGQGEDLTSRWDRQVRLNFRPRTPELFYAEGFRPAQQGASAMYAALPVYLLFDMEAVICHPDSRFSDGDPAKIGKTYKTPAYFRDLPFEQIYHDSWFMPDERDEILRYREAQVIIPERLGLESLQVIWVRSEAEYQTLHQLMPSDVWRRWRDKITTRTDYHLFNNKSVYVNTVILQADSVRLRFNMGTTQADNGPFMAQCIIEYADGEQITWEEEAWVCQNDLVWSFDARDQDYTVQFLLDGELAYVGNYRVKQDLI